METAEDKSLMILGKCVKDGKVKDEEIKKLKKELEEEKAKTHQLSYTLKLKDSRIQEMEHILTSNYFYEQNLALRKKIANLEGNLKKLHVPEGDLNEKIDLKTYLGELDRAASRKGAELDYLKRAEPLSPSAEGIMAVLEKQQTLENLKSENEAKQAEIQFLSQKLEIQEEKFRKFRLEMDRGHFATVRKLKNRILELNPDEPEPTVIYSSPEEAEQARKFKEEFDEVISMIKRIIKKQQAMTKKRSEEIEEEQRKKEELERQEDEEDSEDDSEDDDDEEEEEEESEDSDGWREMDPSDEDEEKQ